MCAFLCALCPIVVQNAFQHIESIRKGAHRKHRLSQSSEKILSMCAFLCDLCPMWFNTLGAHKGHTGKCYLNSNSQGFIPVCFLNAVLKCEMDEYPNNPDTSVTFKPFSHNIIVAYSIRLR